MLYVMRYFIVHRWNFVAVGWLLNKLQANKSAFSFRMICARWLVKEDTRCILSHIRRMITYNLTIELNWFILFLSKTFFVIRLQLSLTFKLLYLMITYIWGRIICELCELFSSYKVKIHSDWFVLKGGIEYLMKVCLKPYDNIITNEIFL